MQFERIMLHSLQYSRSLLPLSLFITLSLCHFGDCDVGYLLIIALRLWPPLSAAFDLLNRKPKWLLVFVSVRFVFFPFSYFAFACFFVFAAILSSGIARACARSLPKSFVLSAAFDANFAAIALYSLF